MLALAGVCLFALAQGHSWVGCTDYRGDVKYYENDKCFGFPRNWEQSRGSATTPTDKGYNLGADTGYNFQSGGQVCQLPRTSPVQNAYTKNFPLAVYEQGKTYCLAWPTKNHVAADCTNQYIPDTQMSIYRSNVNPSTDPAQTEFNSNPVTTNFGAHGNGVIDCLGYQRSPRFCENTDKALATGCFTVPANQAVGYYVYQWYWVFNPGSPYITCWDAQVVAAGQGTGGGGVTGVDSLGTSGLEGICKTKWAQNQGTVTPSTPTTTTPTQNSSQNTAPTTPETTPSLPPLSGDKVYLTKWPSQIGTSGSFDVLASISSAAARQITVDVLDLDDVPTSWHGKGTYRTTGAGKEPNVTITITLMGNPPAAGHKTILRVWTVNTTIFDVWAAPPCNAACDNPAINPWGYELDSADYSVSVGSALAYSNQNCGAVNPPAHSTWTTTPTYAAGSVAQFQCDSGYKVSGSSFIQCVGGTWSGTFGVCSTDSAGAMVQPVMAVFALLAAFVALLF